MKKILFILLVILLPLAFSSCNDEETPTYEEEAKLQAIKCVDNNQNEIDSIDYVIGESEYAFQGVFVYAYYSDGRISDVTTFAEFDNVDLTTVGEKKVSVKYKECIDDFIIVISEIKLNRIEIEHFNVKKEYVINEELNIDGLKVYKIMSNSFFGEIKDYTYTLLDSNSNEIFDKKFKKAGNYLVQIEYQNKFEYFEVFVYEGQYDYSLNIDVSEYENKLVDGYYTFSGIEKIYDESEFNFQSTSGLKMKLKENDQDISYDFIGKTFNYNFELNFESSLIFETFKRFKMLIIIEGINHSDILNITNYDDSVIFYETNETDGNTFVFIEENAGIFNISSDVTCFIKGFLLNVYEDYKCEEITLDFENVKTSFIIGEPFTYENLKVFGKLSNTLIKEIPIEDCSVKVELNGNLIDSFNVNGVYDVVVSYNEGGIVLTASYTIIVQNTIVTYDEISLDVSETKTVYQEGEKFDYSGLIVYGINKNGMEIIDTNHCSIKLFFKDSVEEFEVDNFINTPGDYYVLVTFKNQYQTLTNTYEISYKINLLEYGSKVEPVIQYVSTNSIYITIENVLETIIDVKLLVYYDGQLIHSINSLSTGISNLDSNKIYLVRGYYKGKIGDQEYIVYIENTLIDFSLNS